ncbi:MAG: universal stress protein [Burkholderiaceae bacterium]|jgi:nucleotide-binding universal stress UspA family protein|nr:universal stress protein [Burkholderiaceae bacterium]
MAYKTILLHLDRKETANARIRIAARLALAEDAHLLGVAMVGVSTLTFREARISEKDPALAAHLKFLFERAEGFVENFIHEAKMAGVPSYEGRVVDEEAGYGVSMLARYSDLVVIGQTNLKEEAPLVQPDFPEFVLINSGRPVLMIPHSYKTDTMGFRALVAWNASKESRRALTDAIPLLKRADLVDVAAFNMETEPDMRDDGTLTDLAVFLARHGVKVNILKPQQTKTVGAALLETAEQRKADLLVLGGYGHTRFRQMLLGGVTRTVLSNATLPVLMSH